MRNTRDKFYLVREDVLSESMLKVLQAKQLLEHGQAASVTEAVREVDLSRSAFYKYKDGIFPFHKVVKEEIVTLFFHLEDRAGTLTKILKVMAEANCNILTIHQTIPLQGHANVSLSVDTGESGLEFDELIKTLEKIEEVEKVDIVGTGGL